MRAGEVEAGGDPHKKVKRLKTGEEQQKFEREREKCNVQHHIYTAAWTASRVEDQS